MELAVVSEFAAAVEVVEFDEDGDAGDFGAGHFDEFAGRAHGASGGHEVVDEEDALADAESIGMYFESVRAVFECVVDAVDGAWEFAGFSDGDETGRESLGDGDAEDEAAAFGTDDEVDSLASVWVGHEFDGECERSGIGEQRREVLEDDAGLGEVGHVADKACKVVHGQRISRPRGCRVRPILGHGTEWREKS